MDACAVLRCAARCDVLCCDGSRNQRDGSAGGIRQRSIISLMWRGSGCTWAMKKCQAPRTPAWPNRQARGTFKAIAPIR